MNSICTNFSDENYKFKFSVWTNRFKCIENGISMSHITGDGGPRHSDNIELAVVYTDVIMNISFDDVSEMT